MINFYQATAAKYIEIDEDHEGHLFCTIPSEKDMDIRYRLECKETNAGVEVLSCGCPSRKPCKHAEIVRSFWAKIYKSNAEKVAQKQEREQVYDKDRCTAIYADTREVVDVESYDQGIADSLGVSVEELRDQRKVVDIGIKGSLKGNRGFDLMKRAV